MSDPKGKALEKADDKAPAEGEGEPGKKGWLSWAVGWVMVPGALLGSIFGGGALLGAHFHDSWFVRAIVWMVELVT